MANGSLLNYLRKERTNLLLHNDASATKVLIYSNRALPSVNYSTGVDECIWNPDLGGIVSQPVAKITTNPESCISMLLEKPRKVTGLCLLPAWVGVHQ